MKKLLALVLVTLMIVSMVACAPTAEKEEGTTAADTKAAEENKTDAEAPAASGDVIKIGVFEPFTGASASGGEQTFQGIEIANKEVSEVLGKKIELVKVDNKSEQVEASNAAQRLVDKDKVNAVIGSYGSSLSMAGGDVFKTAEVPAVGCSPTNPAVTLGNDYYFRVCFIDPFQGTVMANFATDTLKAKTAATIKDTASDYSVGLIKYFTEAFKANNGDASIVAEASYKTGDQDFTSQLNNIKQQKPDVIFCPGNYGESALLIKQARDLGIECPILGGDTWEAPELISIGGENINKEVYFSSHFTAEKPQNDVSEAFLVTYKEKYDKPANAFAALGYDAYMVIVDAIKRANSAEPKAIRDALAETKSFIGATGTITLDENGDAVKSAVINQVKDNDFVYLTTVEPKN